MPITYQKPGNRYILIVLKILIIQTAFIGDVILATPVIEKLHAFYPEAEVDFLLRKGNESLLANNPHLRKIHILNKKKHKYINLLKTTGRVRSESYDYVINIHRFLSSGMITAFSKAKNKIGFNKNPLSFFYTHKVLHHIHDKDNPSHETERNLMLIRHITDPAITGPKLYPDENDFSKVSS